MKCLYLVCLPALLAVSSFAQSQQFANLGDFKLDSGETLRDCRIGYRTFGQLNAEKSNCHSVSHMGRGND